MITCSACGLELYVGDYPFCPHGRPLHIPWRLPFDDSPSDEQIKIAAAICADKDTVDGKCVHCGHEMQIGDYPFCPHGSIYPEFAQHFDPISVFVKPNGEYYFPGVNDSEPPAGHQKREIRSIREADKLVRDVNTREDARLEAVHHAHEATRLEKQRRRQESMDAALSRMSPEIRRYVEKRRELREERDQQRERLRPRSADFHIEVFSFDASNREGYADARTNWRSKKA